MLIYERNWTRVGPLSLTLLENLQSPTPSLLVYEVQTDFSEFACTTIRLFVNKLSTFVHDDPLSANTYSCAEICDCLGIESATILHRCTVVTYAKVLLSQLGYDLSPEQVGKPSVIIQDNELDSTQVLQSCLGNVSFAGPAFIP